MTHKDVAILSTKMVSRGGNECFQGDLLSVRCLMHEGVRPPVEEEPVMLAISYLTMRTWFEQTDAQDGSKGVPGRLFGLLGAIILSQRKHIVDWQQAPIGQRHGQASPCTMHHTSFVGFFFIYQPCKEGIYRRCR